jgi:hypothetical protein
MAADKKSSKKTFKSTSKAKESSKVKEEREDKPEPAPLPTPPPESKSSKKDRPRVVRDGASSWGAWGATPRKEEKPSKELKEEKRSKDADPSDAKRTKSSRRTSERDEKVSKNSSSDKDDRPPISRGISAMFGGSAPLSRSKSVSERRTSTSGRTSSRRQSLVGTGIMSPPPDDAKNPPEMSGKAAKLLGVTPAKLSRSKSERKSKSRGKRTSFHSCEVQY